MKKLMLVVMMIVVMGCAKGEKVLDNVVDDIQGVVCPESLEDLLKECEKSADRLEAAYINMSEQHDMCEEDWANYQRKSTLRR